MIRGSELSNQICENVEEKGLSEVPRHQPNSAVWGAPENDVLLRLCHSGKVIPSSDSSEEAASIIHLMLTISI